MTELPDAAERAVALLQRYTAGDLSICEAFDETLSDRLAPEMLADAWSQVTNAVGDFLEFDDAAVRQMQGHTVVDVPMRFERGEMKGRIAFDAQGNVAGLFILNPAVV